MSKKIPVTKLGATGVLIQERKILLGLREKTDSSLPGMWCLPGGGVEFGETINAAIAREFMEEVGLKVSVSNHFISVQESIRAARHSVLIAKRVLFTSGKLIAGDGFDEVAWFDRNALAFFKGIITPMSFGIISDFLIQTGDEIVS
jgi:ADP-ribose pyrophosphatase YjhB (NUDIX family)